MNFIKLALPVMLMLPVALLSAPKAEAQIQCWQQNGQTVCRRPNGGQNDAACQATAQFKYCQASVYVGCQSWRSTSACRLLQLSYSNPNAFQQIMSASKSCNLDRNQQACNFLTRNKGYYY